MFVFFIDTTQQYFKMASQSESIKTTFETNLINIQTEDGVRIIEKHVKNIKAYKILGNETTLADYVKNSSNAAVHSVQLPDWYCLYMQFQREHVLGTVPYRWDHSHTNKEYMEANLSEAIFEDLTVLVVDGPMFHQGSVSGEEKAEILKKLLNIEGSLMDEIGKRGQVALIRETEEEWELLIPYSIFFKLKFTEEVNIRFFRDEKYPLTSRWCDLQKNKIKIWDDYERISEQFIPNLNQSWITDILSENLEN